jgi:hypothetical protein
MARRRYSNVLTSRLTRFVQLNDVPQDYVGRAGQALVVNATEDGLEFNSAPTLNPSTLLDSTIYTVPAASAVGSLIHLTSATAAVLADNTILTTLPIVGVVASKPSTTTAIIQSIGFIDGLSGLVAGSSYYLSTAGSITNTPPTTPGTALYPVGVARSATRLELMINSDYIIRA